MDIQRGIRIGLQLNTLIYSQKEDLHCNLTRTAMDRKVPKFLLLLSKILSVIKEII